MSHPGISLIAGLGNPGNEHADTRHNAGFWFIAALQQAREFTLSLENKFHAETGAFVFNDKNVRVVAPTTFMNLSGQSVAPYANFYRIPVEAILVVHDELDLPPGTVRLKQGGGFGGHNGLQDIAARLGSPDFARLRIGIGHPGDSRACASYVLQKPRDDERGEIIGAIDEVITQLPKILAGDFAGAMQTLHTDSRNA